MHNFDIFEICHLGVVLGFGSIAFENILALPVSEQNKIKIIAFATLTQTTKQLIDKLIQFE